MFNLFARSAARRGSEEDMTLKIDKRVVATGITHHVFVTDVVMFGEERGTACGSLKGSLARLRGWLLNLSN